MLTGRLDIRAVALDYYGTLVDVGKPFDRIRDWFTEQYRSSGVDPLVFFHRFSRERARRYTAEFRLGYELLLESYEATCCRFGLPSSPFAFKEYLFSLFSNPPAFAGAGETVERLRGRFPVALLTNADNAILYRSIEKQHFHFDFIVTSEDMRCNKPEPVLFHKTGELLGFPLSQIVMIGDSFTEDVQGAVSVGMPAIWISQAVKTPGSGVLRVSSVQEAADYILSKREGKPCVQS